MTGEMSISPAPDASDEKSGSPEPDQLDFLFGQVTVHMHGDIDEDVLIEALSEVDLPSKLSTSLMYYFFLGYTSVGLTEQDCKWYEANYPRLREAIQDCLTQAGSSIQVMWQVDDPRFPTLEGVETIEPNTEDE
jgi:hypothetical protein